MRTTSRQLIKSRWLAHALIMACVLLCSSTALAQTTLAETAPESEAADTQRTDAPDDDQAAPQEGSDDAAEDDAADDDTAVQPAESPATNPKPASESSPRDDETFFGESHRRRMYEQSKLSHTKALLYTLALPGLGNIYAEQYFLAGLAFSLMAFTTMFVLYGATTQQPQFVHMGLVTGGVAYTGGALSSYFGVRKYNNRLREGFNLSDASPATSPFDVPRVRTVGVTIRF